MSYRPITDFWILARARLKDGRKYYGAYLGGFPERARVLLGVPIERPLLHVCGGLARYYPYPAGFGPNDKTLDLDPTTEPDILQDARNPFPYSLDKEDYWDGILMDPPYSEVDAAHYAPGAAAYPSPNLLVRNGIDAVRVGGRVGIIHYIWPAEPKNAKCVASIAVTCGRNNRIRNFTVFVKTS